MGRRILKGIPQEMARLIDSKFPPEAEARPTSPIPSVSIEIVSGGKAEKVLRRLRELPIPIIATIENDRVRLSLATM